MHESLLEKRRFKFSQKGCKYGESSMGVYMIRRCQAPPPCGWGWVGLGPAVASAGLPPLYRWVGSRRSPAAGPPPPDGVGSAVLPPRSRQAAAAHPWAAKPLHTQRLEAPRQPKHDTRNVWRHAGSQNATHVAFGNTVAAARLRGGRPSAAPVLPNVTCVAFWLPACLQTLRV